MREKLPDWINFWETNFGSLISLTQRNNRRFVGSFKEYVSSGGLSQKKETKINRGKKCFIDLQTSLLQIKWIAIQDEKAHLCSNNKMMIKKYTKLKKRKTLTDST